jgi:hypothetical protein
VFQRNNICSTILAKQPGRAVRFRLIAFVQLFAQALANRINAEG